AISRVIAQAPAATAMSWKWSRNAGDCPGPSTRRPRRSGAETAATTRASSATFDNTTATISIVAGEGGVVAQELDGSHAEGKGDMRKVAGAGLKMRMVKGQGGRCGRPSLVASFAR
ncbi:unnamed protein product, partial [Sphacelaria rigidula]